MLQRPQTLFLLTSFLVSLLLLTGPFVVFTGEKGELVLKFSGVFAEDGARLELATWPMTVVFILIAALTFFDIFAYRQRILQMRICVFLIFFNAGSIGMIFYYIFMVRNNFEAGHVVHQWRMVLPLISVILLYLAFRGIRRDELLVKAYERIR